MHSINESLLSDVVNKIKNLPDFGEIKKKFKDVTGVDLESKVDITDDSSSVKYTGKVDFNNGGFTSEQKENIKTLLSEMEKEGITDPYTQIGILSVIDKESGFKPQSEQDYSKTSNSTIRNIFGKRVRGYSEDKLTKLKSKPKSFFNIVYANMIGNDGPKSGDGYKYRGRGFNQLTGKGNYEKYGSLIGVNLVENPDKLNEGKVAAKVALYFLTKGKSDFPKFNSKEDAAAYFSKVNAGGKSGSHTSKSLNSSRKFNIK